VLERLLLDMKCVFMHVDRASIAVVGVMCVVVALPKMTPRYFVYKRDGPFV
jgi:hypothetical protein